MCVCVRVWVCACVRAPSSLSVVLVVSKSLIMIPRCVHRLYALAANGTFLSKASDKLQIRTSVASWLVDVHDYSHSG